MAGRVLCAQCGRVPGMLPCIGGSRAGRAHVQQSLAMGRGVRVGRLIDGIVRRRLTNNAVHHQFGAQRIAAHRLAHIDLGQAAVATVVHWGGGSRRNAADDWRRRGRGGTDWFGRRQTAARRRPVGAAITLNVCQLRQTRTGERSLVGGQRRDAPQVDHVAAQIVVRFVQHRIGCQHQWRTAVSHDQAVAATKVHVAEGQFVGGRLQVAGEPTMWALVVVVVVVIVAIRFCFQCI